MFSSGLTPYATSPYATAYLPYGYSEAAAFDPYAGAYGGLYGDPVATAYGAMPTAYFASPAYESAALVGVDPLASLANALVPEDAAAGAGFASAGSLAAPLGFGNGASVGAAAPEDVAAAFAAYAPAARRSSRRGAAGARTHRGEVWAGRRDPRRIHVTQVASRFNANPVAGNRDCGPASVVMSLRMLGVRVPGAAANATPQRLFNRVRALANAGPSSVATTNYDLERALRRAGVTTAEINDRQSIHAAVLAGRPVILNGNPRNPGAYGHRFSASAMSPYDGGHWIVVSGYDPRSRRYIINDPLSKAGAVKVTARELEGYRGGSIGIEVAA